MEQQKGSILLKFTLIIFAVMAVVYGIGYLFFTDFLVELSGSEPVDASWLRWAGATISALGIGAIFIFMNPSKQGAFVLTLMLGNLFTGLAMLYTWIFELATTTWFTAVPTLLLLLVACLFYISWLQNKELLKQ
jgi:hypothetical protein